MTVPPVMHVVSSIAAPSSRIGLLTMAFGGDKYIRQAEILALSVRRNMPGYTLAIVSDRTLDPKLFDICIPMRAIETAGTVHKVDMYRYSPFEETLFIDSDCVVVRDFTEQIEAIRQFDFSPVVGTYLRAGDEDLWLEDVGRALKGVGGTHFPKFNGGVYFFRKGAVAERIFVRSAEIRARAAELGIKDFDRSGPGEETLIGLALASLGHDALYDDGGRLMRTPLGLSGRLIADPIKRVSRFTKYGRVVEPAITHFCGPWIDHPAYQLAAQALRDGRAPGMIARWRRTMPFAAMRMLQRAERRLPRVGAR